MLHLIMTQGPIMQPDRKYQIKNPSLSVSIPPWFLLCQAIKENMVVTTGKEHEPPSAFTVNLSNT